MPRRLLLLTYHFPPDPSIGSIRPRALARYLPSFDWEVDVATRTYPGGEASFEGTQVVRASDPGSASTLLKGALGLDRSRSFQEQLGVPRSLRAQKRSTVARTFARAKGALTFPDDEWPWGRALAAVLEAQMRARRYEAVLSTSPPNAVHWVARAAAARLGVPWVADMRDLWSENPHYEYGPLRRRVDRAVERRVLAGAAAIVTVSEPLAAQQARLLGREVLSIPNGFDPRDVRRATPTEAFTITHTGRLYHGRRDPQPLLRAVRTAIDAGVMDRARVRVRFYGPHEPWLDDEIAREQLQGVAEQLGPVAREEALARQAESQLLLLLTWNDPRNTGVYTGKVFEYLAANRPLLALGPGGVVEELLTRTRAGRYCRSVDELEAALRGAYADYLRLGAVPHDPVTSEVTRHAHPGVAERFAGVLDRVVSGSLGSSGPPAPRARA